MTVTKADLANTLYEQLGLNKREAKELVDGAPSDILTGVSKEDADKAKEALEGAGATVELK